MNETRIATANDFTFDQPGYRALFGMGRSPACEKRLNGSALSVLYSYAHPAAARMQSKLR